MNLGELRKTFVDLSGRTELVQDTVGYADRSAYGGVGANWFINAGQRFLDRLPYAKPNDDAVLETVLVAGSYLYETDLIRAVKGVRLQTSTGSQYLNKRTVEQLRGLFGDTNTFTNTSPGTPVYFAPTTMRVANDPTPQTEGSRGIIFLPPADVNYTIFIEGMFYSPKLVNDGDVSFWTIQHPETLIQAAWYQLERFMRNREGMRDHLEAILEDLRGMDFDMVEEAIAGEVKVLDSWRFFYGR